MLLETDEGRPRQGGRFVDLNDYELLQVLRCRLGRDYDPMLHLDPPRFVMPDGATYYIWRWRREDNK